MGIAPVPPVILLLAPSVVTGWPVLLLIASSAATALGLHMAEEMIDAKAAARALNLVEIDVAHFEIVGEALKSGETISMTGYGMTVRIFLDERGMVRVTVEGPGRTRNELEHFGRHVVEKMTQMFLYDKLIKDLKAQNCEIVSSEIGTDEAVHIKVRRQVGG